MPLGAARLNGLARYIVTTAQGKTITVNGDVAVSSYGKIGNSAYLDGNGDRIIVDPSSDFEFGTGDFTFEGWFFMRPNGANSTGTLNDIISNRDTSGYAAGQWYLRFYPYYGRLYFAINGQTTLMTETQTQIQHNAWNHFAVTRSSGTVTIWVNGVSKATSTMTGVVGNSTYNQIVLGLLGSTGTLAASKYYIDEVRVSNIARYSTTFTPTTTGFSKDANTVLLIHADSTITDDVSGSYSSPGAGTAPPTNATTNRWSDLTYINDWGTGNLNTTYKKFGTASFDSYNSGAPVASSIYYHKFPKNELSTNWTIEGWLMLPAATTGQKTLITMGNSGGSVSLRPQGSNVYDIEYSLAGGNWNSNGLQTWTYGTWYHWAIVKSSTTTAIFLNGIRRSSRSDTSANPWALTNGNDDIMHINAGNNVCFIDSMRISKVARYTVTNTTLTIPTAEWASDSNTLFLMNFNGTNGSTTVTETT